MAHLEVPNIFAGSAMAQNTTGELFFNALEQMDDRITAADAREIAVQGLSQQLCEAKIEITQLQELSETDQLTGLANRRAFMKDYHKRQAVADRRTAANNTSVMVIDLDGFKQVNDQVSYAAGDAVLIKVAEILNMNVRSADDVYRWGGDEFVILLEGITTDRSDDVATAIIQEIADTTPVTASIGIGAADFKLEPSDIIATANHALHSAKANGKNAVVRFDEELAEL